MRRLLPLSLAAAFGCNQCEPPPEPQRGNLERPGDIVVVTPPGQDGDPHTLAFVSNPGIEQLRVFDVSLLPEGGFVRAPNVFFPMSILTGPSTSDLAAPRGLPARVLALDSAADEVYGVRTAADDGGAAFTRVGAPVPTTGEPAAIDAALLGDDLVVFVALPDDGALEAIALDPVTGEERARGTLPLPDGARPTDIAIDPTLASVVMADAVQPFVTIVDVTALAPADDGAAFSDAVAAAPVRALDVGGPTRRVAVGRVDPGDGLAPVAMFLRRDADEVAVVRLFRPGYREERAALLGRAAIPGVPLSGYVPDQGAGALGPVVCCQGLSGEQLVEATAAWAAIATADGVIYYLAVDAPRGDGTTLVRLIDVDAAAPATDPDFGDPNANVELWVVPDDAASPRPTVAFTAVDNFGSPPVVPLIDEVETLTLTWEGVLPGLGRVPATFADGVVGLDTVATPAGLDVRAGDLLELTVDDPPPGCDATFPARIVAVDDASVDVAVAGAGVTPALSADDVDCIEGGGAVTAAIRAADAFLVDSTTRGHLGRLAFADVAGDESALELPGVVLTVSASPDGEPATGSALVLPLDPFVSTIGLSLSQQPVDGREGFGDFARQPIAMAGGFMKVPSGDDDDALLDARRILLITPSLLFSFDEGETDLEQVATYR